LIGRMRRAGGPELIINAIPFGPEDEDNVEKFVSRVDTAFIPRPQGSGPAIVVESNLPEAFETFRAIWKKTRKNLAAIAVPVGVPPRKSYYAALWSAIWSGWREGYSLGVEIPIAQDSVDAAKDIVRDAPGYTRFALDVSGLGDGGLEAAAQ